MIAKVIYKITPRFIKNYIKSEFSVNSKKSKALTEEQKVSFFNDLSEFNKQGKEHGITALESNLYPCLDDNTTYTGFDGHYIYHPAWAARIVKQIAPDIHIDISSTLHFCTILSAFIPVDFYDYRPAQLNLDNLNSKKGDLMKLPFESNSVKSISCMHTIEHVGLGRYGDPIDPIGDIKALNELKRVCASGGNLLLVVPVGNPKVMFNAHRIYDPQFIINQFEGFELLDFSAVLDNQTFSNNPKFELIREQSYGCGCFWFKKL